MRGARHSGFDFRDIHVLVVEDEEFARNMTCQVMRLFGCASVQAAENGNLATDMMITATRSFDLIVCDVRMPQMNGLELLKSVRRGVPGVARDIPFAMLTGNADKPVVGLAFKLDVDCFLIKPVTANNMRERITRVMTTERTIKSPFDYHDIDVDVVDMTVPKFTRSGPAIRTKPKPKAPSTEDRQLAAIDKAVSMGRKVKLNDLQAGSKLSDSIKTRNGQVLVTEGSTLDERTIERLRDLAELDDDISSVQIRE